MDDEYKAIVTQRLEPSDITNDRTQVLMEDAHRSQVDMGSKASAHKSDQTTVQAVDRAITLLETLAEAKLELRLQDIAQMTGLKLSTCHHLLNTLLRRGYVSKMDKPRAYFLGPRISEIASMRGARFDLVREAQPILNRLAADSGATIRLAAFDGTDLTTLYELPGETGTFAPGVAIAQAAHATALGKAILAWLPEPEIARVVADHGLPRLTNQTINSLGELVESLREIRRHGFAIEDREFCAEEVAIACVIREKAGAVFGAVGASVLAKQCDNERLLRLQLQVSETAREISAKCRF